MNSLSFRKAAALGVHEYPEREAPGRRLKETHKGRGRARHGGAMAVPGVVPGTPHPTDAAPLHLILSRLNSAASGLTGGLHCRHALRRVNAG